MKIANAALEVLKRQCWWLSERMVPLALFSRSADEDTLAALAAAMMAAMPDEDTPPVEPGKPSFPVLKKEMQLKDFVGDQSWVFFNRIGDKGDWLVKAPSDWPSDPTFVSTKEIVDALHGVNDIAERGCRRAEFYKV